MEQLQQRHQFMREAIALAERSVANGGGPFGAVVVYDGRIIGRGHNRVTLDNDPTAHAEVVAIREACRTLGDFRLDGCELYVSCEPCPMCLAACYWAHLERIYYAGSTADAAEGGFDDGVIYQEVCVPAPQRRIIMAQLLPEEAATVFAAWQAKPDRIDY